MKRVFASIALFLLVVIAVEWLLPVQLPKIKTSGNGNIAVTSSADVLAKADRTLSFPAEEAYQSVKDRPLFFEGRRPSDDGGPEQEPAKPESPRKLPPLKYGLTAIVMVNDETYAIFKGKNDGSSRVRVGEELDGWLVDKIMTDKVVLTNGSVSQEMALREYAPVQLPAVKNKKRAAPTRNERTLREKSTRKISPTNVSRGTARTKAALRRKDED